MKILKNRSKFANICLRFLGLSLSVVPPALCALFYFPLWKEEGGSTALSGICALLLALSAIPIYKWLRHRLRSPSAYTVWLILFLVFFLLSRVADEMTVIAFVGFIGNLLGALCFKISEVRRDER